MEFHGMYDSVIETYIALVLTVEYLWGRSDTDIKKEEKRRAGRKKPEFEELNQGEGK